MSILVQAAAIRLLPHLPVRRQKVPVSGGRRSLPVIASNAPARKRQVSFRAALRLSPIPHAFLAIRYRNNKEKTV